MSTPAMMPRPLPSERLLALEGGCNFRDIGGYPALEGRAVRWGRVYRAGVLSYFTEQDSPALARLGVRAICDLRREEERRREPTRWPDAAARTLSWEDERNVPTIRVLAAKRPATAAGMRDAMLDLYRALPAWMAGRIAGLFQCAAAGNMPMVVHCAAGKDRTGIAIAVLLLALGVPRDIVIEDYLLTNEAGDFEQFIRARTQAELGLADARHPLLEMPEDVRAVLFDAHPAYLEAALQQIAAEFGSVQDYLQAAGIDESTRAHVREQLLT